MTLSSITLLALLVMAGGSTANINWNGIITQLDSSPRKDRPVQDWSKFIDETKAAKVPVVLRVKFLSAEGGNKFGWDKVGVLAVLKNESKQHFDKPLEVAHYSWEPGVPKGESTIYLEPYSDSADHLWKLLEASGKHGVSHVKPEP